MTALEHSIDMVIIRTAIKEEMDRMDISVTELAAAANVNTNTVCRFLDGFTFSPHTRTTNSMARALGFNIIWSQKGRVAAAL